MPSLLIRWLQISHDISPETRAVPVAQNPSGTWDASYTHGDVFLQGNSLCLSSWNLKGVRTANL